MHLSTKESDILRAVLEWLHWHHIFVFRVNNTGIFDPTQKRFRSFQGMKGVSDILGIINGRFLAIEVKRPGQKPRPDQAEFLKEINNQGGLGIVVHSLDELEKQLGPFMGCARDALSASS
jgi:hypothetical protein